MQCFLLPLSKNTLNWKGDVRKKYFFLSLYFTLTVASILKEQEKIVVS